MLRINTGATRGKFSRRQFRRAPLGAKQGNKNYLKGTGGRKIGHHTTKGHYVVQQHKIMEIVMPEQMAGIKLTPYVAYNAPHVKVPPHAAAPQAAQAVDANER